MFIVISYQSRDLALYDDYEAVLNCLYCRPADSH